MNGLRILITNWTLAGRHGSVLYTHDLALGLFRNGHLPIVYSPELGEVAEELRAATIPVVLDLRCLAAPPAVIHGNSHPDLMAALLHFPGVPAVHACHAWGLHESGPPRFPRVRRYLAVDDTCRDWLVCTQEIPEDRVRVVFNGVDLRRFTSRFPLPARPQRALLFSNYASEQAGLPVVRAACQHAGLSLDVMGEAAGHPCARPEERLGHYDLVLAKGRCAREALAVGCAVVLCGARSAGPLVTSANWQQLQRLNFGRRALRDPLRADVLVRAIKDYDAADATTVARQVRARVGLDATVQDVAALYHEVIAEQARAGCSDWESERRAIAAYFQEMDTFQLIRRIQHDHGRAVAARDAAEAQWAAVRVELTAAQAELATAQAELAATRATLVDMHNSSLVRLRNRLARMPLLGRCLRTLAGRARAG